MQIQQMRPMRMGLPLDHQADVLDVLKTGVINDEVTKAIEETAAMVAKQYS